MSELTDEQKRECEKVANAVLDYLWEKLKIKMESVSFEEALKELKEEIMND